MKHIFIKLSFLLGTISLCSCAPINTDFSCNVTAGDKCMSIEEVNAMTEAHSAETRHIKRSPKLYRQRAVADETQTIWLAPWVDTNGALHTHDVMVAKLNSSKGQNHVG